MKGLIYKIDKNKYVCKGNCFKNLGDAIKLLKKNYNCDEFNVLNADSRTRLYWLEHWKDND